MNWKRSAALATASGLALGLAAFGALGGRDIPAAELEARYGQPPSQFIELDGVRMHYRDEGAGPPVVLIHGHLASLLMWQPWVDALADRYRLVRFDMTSHGLTGPDPTGDYSLERTVVLLERLVDALGLERFALAGSTLGATVALHYAARNPGRVERLLLVNPAAAHGRAYAADAGELPLTFELAPRLTAAAMLREGFGDPSRVTAQLVEEWATMWRREGNRAAERARVRQYAPGDVEGCIRAVRAPVLLMWGDLSPELRPEQTETLRQLLRRARSVRIDVLRGIGRMAVQEDPSGTARRAREFLDAGNAAVPPDPESLPDMQAPLRRKPDGVIEREMLVRAA